MKMPTESIGNNTELKRYLYSEMTEDQRAEMEEKLFLDDDLFFEAANLENELVDLYVGGKLDGKELERFERSLESQPERRQKVANAAALREFIDDEREIEAPQAAITEGQSLWQKIAGAFTLGTPALGYGMAGLLAIFALLSIVLITDNFRKANDIARLQAEQTRVTELESQLASHRERENELQNQIDTERETGGELTEELERERERRERIEAELSQLKKDREPTQPGPIIATYLLMPNGSGKGGGDGEIKDIKVAPGTKRIAMQLGLPDSVKAGERFSVTLNTRPIARNVAARSAANGRKTVHVAISPGDLQDGPNRLGVVNASGSEVGRYIFNFQSRK